MLGVSIFEFLEELLLLARCLLEGFSQEQLLEMMCMRWLQYLLALKAKH